jgi:hypothetical protein
MTVLLMFPNELRFKSSFFQNVHSKNLSLFLQVKLKRRERSVKPPKAVSGELVGCCWSAWPGGGWCLRVGGGLAALLVSALLGYAALLFHTKILTLERRLLAGE